MPDTKPLAITGRIVTMDQAGTVINDGVLYIAENRIVGVQSSSSPPPAGFKRVKPLVSGGTVYPGLIELHNHLSYNVLPLWQVTNLYQNRDQWSRIREYRVNVTGPIAVLARTPGMVAAIVRYVECRCLVGGVTSSQGIALASNQGIQRFYRGLIRNVEQPEQGLKSAKTHILDVEARDARKFLAALKKNSCLLLHLSEGVDASARSHFEALQIDARTWAIGPSLASIHCVALKRKDFKIMAANQGKAVWSPLSNLLLYGKTANIQAMKSERLTIAVGSDWSPSGSKNLLGELKVAKLLSDQQGNVFSDRELVAMATSNPAAILTWEGDLGSLEAGKLADAIVISGAQSDPYRQLLNATESDIELVVIDGVPRYGTRGALKGYKQTERWKLGRSERRLNLHQEDADPIVKQLTLKEAVNKLKAGLAKVVDLAKNLERPKPQALTRAHSGESQWTIVLDHEEPEGIAQRPHLMDQRRRPTATLAANKAAAVPLSQIVKPLKLEPLTAVDDTTFWQRVKAQPNLPAFIKQGLPN